MPRITKVYTRTGDDGSTGLGSGRRVRKDALRIEAYGTVDELSSAIGAALAVGVQPGIGDLLRTAQNDLFHLGSDLCFPEEDKEQSSVPRIEERHIHQLEEWMDLLSEELEPLENFILPGGSVAAAHLHLARTICRRAERRLVSLADVEAVGEHTISYLNRLSDTLFVMARSENRARGVDDMLWDSRA